MIVPEAAASANPTPGELFAARLPELEGRINALTPSGTINPLDACVIGGIVGIAHVRGVVDGASGIVTVSRRHAWEPRTRTMVSGYSMRPLNDSPFIVWPEGATLPEEVQFRRHTGRNRPMHPSFAKALLLADVVMVAEPLSAEDLPMPPAVTSRILRGLGKLATEVWELWGEQGGRRGRGDRGDWPHHP